MKAWIVTEPKKLECCTIPVPIPKPDEVLIKISVSCLCNGSDPGIFNGHEAYTPPFVFGHEASGIIVEVGEEVIDFKIGDFVFCWCAPGAFAKYQAISPKKVAMFHVPKNLQEEETPILELVIASCRALMHKPATEKRKKLTICGLGPSGLILLQYARLLGYEKIIGWDLYESRRKLALELGIDEVFDPAIITKESLKEMDLSDISVVTMGDDKLPGEPTITNLMRVTAVGGTILSYGHPENGRRFSPFVFQYRNLTMEGPENDLSVIKGKGKFVMDALEKGLIRVEPIITHRLKFDDIGNAFKHLLDYPEDQIKVIFKMQEVIL